MEKWEPLGIHLKVLVSKSHSFTTDSLLLAHFSAPRRAEPCADLGTGTAVIPLLWCGRASPGPILALELQPEAARMATRTVEANGLSQRITVLQADAREFKRHLPHQALGLVACNPPYFSAGTGLPPANPARAQARQAESLTLLDLALAARYGLKFGGRLCLCLPVHRLAEAVCLFSAQRLEPKRIRLVQQSPQKEPYLFLLECRLGAKPGLKAEPVLCIRGEDGRYTREMQEIYGDYTENALNIPCD